MMALFEKRALTLADLRLYFVKFAYQCAAMTLKLEVKTITKFFVDLTQKKCFNFQICKK